MNVVRHVSVRTILTAVFVTLAGGLIAALGVQVYAAFDAASLAHRISSLTTVDREVFAAMQGLRAQRNAIVAAYQSPDDASAAIRQGRSKSQAAFAAAMSALAGVPIANVDGMRAAVEARWAEVGQRLAEVEELARKPKSARDPKGSERWYAAITGLTSSPMWTRSAP